MKPVIRTAARFTQSLVEVMAAAILFLNFISATAYAQKQNIDGAFAAIEMTGSELLPSLDGSVQVQPKLAKTQRSTKPSSKTLLADILGSGSMTASQFTQVVVTGAVQAVQAVQVADQSEGILIAVEKKDRSGNVERKNAIVTVEDLDPTEINEPEHRGISISLGDEHPVVHVLSTTVGLSVQPAEVVFSHSGSAVEFSIDELSGATNDKTIQIYPRDPALLHWDAKTRILTATANHVRTELYVARAGQLVVVPVITGTPAAIPGIVAANRQQLAIPPELVRLPTSGGSKHAMLAMGDSGSKDHNEAAAGAGTVGIHASKEDAARTGDDAAAQEVKLRRVSAPSSRSSLRLKLTDDRTPSSGDRAYPVSAAQVYVAGAEFSSTSDAHGVVALSDLPAGASLLIASNDPSGTYVRIAATVDIPAAQNGARVYQRDLIVPRTFAFDAWTRMAGLVQDPALGSMCLDFTGKQVDAIRAQLDVKSQGPFHFNSDGVLDHAASATLEAGRTCWFNIDPGPVNASAWRADRQVMASEFAVLAGRHTHEKVRLVSDVLGFHVQFARESAGHEQLGGEAALQRYVLEDEQEAVLVATTQKLFSTGGQTQGVGSLTTAEGGSSVVYLDSPDFEPAIYRVGSGVSREISVLPAVPRGFVQDMAVFAQQSQEFTAGSVLVEFSPRQGQGPEKIEFRLVNEYGHDVTEPWVFSDMPLTKAMFFNVPPGVYSLIIESKTGGWHGAETVSVYGEALSVVQSGSQLAPYIAADAHH